MFDRLHHADLSREIPQKLKIIDRAAVTVLASPPAAAPVTSVAIANSKTATKSSTEKKLSIVLLYTHCSVGQFGDYAQTGEVAYALDKHCQEEGVPQQFVLTSTDDGIKKFKQLYLKNPADQTLSIHGRSFKFATLEEIASTGRASKVSHFIRVTECGKFDLSHVLRATNQSTKFLFLGAPWNKTSLSLLSKIQFIQEDKEGRVAHLCMGVGANRIGLTIYNGPLEVLDHKAYHNLTTIPFGFAYFKNRGGNISHKSSFAGDYMRITYCSHYRARNYVFIGDADDIKTGIQQFLNEHPKLRVILDAPSRATQCYTLHADGSLHIESVSESKSREGFDVIRIVELERVSNEQMRALMQFSIPFIGAAGAMSVLEGLVLSKIVLTPYLSCNQNLYDQHDQSIATLTSASFDDRIQKLVKLLRWDTHKGFSSDERKHIINELDDQQLNVVLRKANAQLTTVDNAANRICQELGLPYSASPVTIPSANPAASISCSETSVSATKNRFAMFTRLDEMSRQNKSNSLAHTRILSTLFFNTTHQAQKTHQNQAQNDLVIYV